MDQRNNLERFTIHGKLTASGAELSDEKAVRNMERDRGSRPATPPQEGWVGQVEAYGEVGMERFVRQGRQHHGGYGII